MGGLVEGLVYKEGLYDSSSLNKILDSYFSSTTVKRNINIGTTSMLTGSYVSNDETAIKANVVKIL